ncbi:MAG: ribonuclease P protein component [Sediminibacterium sp.]|nr:ribonuclease P protein component [Sediminibacterium sp.]
MKNTFHKQERLCSQTQIDLLFAKGTSVKAYPLKGIYLETSLENAPPVRVMIVVPKRLFKRAVDRNLLKRRIREAYRLQKNEFYTRLNGKQINLSILYIARETVDYHAVFKGVRKLLLAVSPTASQTETPIAKQNNTSGITD